MVIARSARPRPMKLTIQWNTVLTRFLNPVKKGSPGIDVVMVTAGFDV